MDLNWARHLCDMTASSITASTILTKHSSLSYFCHMHNFVFIDGIVRLLCSQHWHNGFHNLAAVCSRNWLLKLSKVNRETEHMMQMKYFLLGNKICCETTFLGCLGSMLMIVLRNVKRFSSEPPGCVAFLFRIFIPLFHFSSTLWFK